MSLSSCSLSSNIDQELFKIYVNGKCGCINKEGNEILPLIYDNVHCDSKKYIPIRINDTFRFIDLETGEIVKKFHYEYLSELRYDLRLGYRNDSIFVLSDTTILIATSIADPADLEIHESNYITVKKGSKVSVYDSFGVKRITLPANEIDIIGDQLLVSSLDHFPGYRDSLPSYVYDIGIINLQGDTIIEFGKYTSFEKLTDSLFLAETIEAGPLKYGRFTDVINIQTGSISKRYDETLWIEIVRSKNERYLKVSDFVDSVDYTDINKTLNADRFSYVIDTADTYYLEDDFYEESLYIPTANLFLALRNDSLKIISEEGKLLFEGGRVSGGLYDFYDGNDIYDHLLYKQGIIAKIDTTIYHITKYSYQILPGLNGRDIYNTSIMGRYKNYLILRRENTTWSDISTTEYFYEVYDLRDEKKLDLKFRYFSPEYLEKGILILGNEKEDVVYSLDSKRIIYTAPLIKNTILNVDYQLANDINTDSLIEVFSEFAETMNLIVDTTKTAELFEFYQGYEARLENFTNDTIRFDVQDGRLYAFVQVYENSEWKPIERFINSWCGNSYTDRALAPGQGWRFVVPKYDGGVKAKFRLNIYTFEGNERVDYFSNEYEGRYNPSQLWREAEYKTDPYKNIEYRY